MIRKEPKAVGRGFLVACVLALLAASASPAWAAGGDDDDDLAPNPMVIADFNRDGIPDMAEVAAAGVGPGSRGVLTVLLGQSDGSFRPFASNAVLGRAPQSMVMGDFNGDGIPDVIVGDADGSVIELLGDGNGNLVPVAGEITHLGSVVSIAVADFNHDGKLDIAVSDSKGSSVTVFLGAGNGTFRSVWTIPIAVPGTVVHVAAADFNGDGIPDLAITNADQDSFEVLVGTGNGTFTASPGLSKLRDANSHCAA